MYLRIHFWLFCVDFLCLHANQIVYLLVYNRDCRWQNLSGNYFLTAAINDVFEDQFHFSFPILYMYKCKYFVLLLTPYVSIMFGAVIFLKCNSSIFYLPDCLPISVCLSSHLYIHFQILSL